MALVNRWVLLQTIGMFGDEMEARRSTRGNSYELC